MSCSPGQGQIAGRKLCSWYSFKRYWIQWRHLSRELLKHLQTLQNGSKIVIKITHHKVYKPEFESTRWEMQMPLIPTVIMFTSLVYFHALLTFGDSALIKSAATISCECGAMLPADVILLYLFTQSYLIRLCERCVCEFLCVYCIFFYPLWGSKMMHINWLLFSFFFIHHKARQSVWITYEAAQFTISHRGK